MKSLRKWIAVALLTLVPIAVLSAEVLTISTTTTTYTKTTTTTKTTSVSNQGHVITSTTDIQTSTTNVSSPDVASSTTTSSSSISSDGLLTTTVTTTVDISYSSTSHTSTTTLTFSNLASNNWGTAAKRASIQIAVSDSGNSSLSQLQVFRNNSFVDTAPRSGGTYYFPSTGSYTFKATVSSGNSATSSIYDIQIDTKDPTIDMTTHAATGWNTSTSSVWGVAAVDDPDADQVKSGIPAGSATYKIAYTPDVLTVHGAEIFDSPANIVAGPTAVGTSTTSISIPASGDSGAYYVLVEAVDAAGNAATPVFDGPYTYDHTSPNFPTPLPTTSLISQQSKMKFQWTTATDDKSGLASYTLSYRYGSTTVDVGSLPSSTTSQTIGLTSLMYGTTVTFTLTAIDVAGNRNAVSATLVVPPKIDFTGAQYVSTAGGNMNIDVKFHGIDKAKLALFTGTITLHRVSSDSAVSLADVTLHPSQIASTVDVAGSPWRTSGADILYTDQISVTSGAGHKTLSYTVTPSPQIDPPSAVSVATLPNNPGVVSAFVITDSAGNTQGSPDFGKVFERTFTVQFQGSDPDHDDWKYEIDKVTQLATGILNTQNLSGTTQTSLPYSSGYALQTKSITLEEGDNNVRVSWQEGDSGAFYSSYLNVHLNKIPINGFYVTVTNLGSNLSTDNATITTRPGEVLTFSIAPDNDANTIENYTWHFGDVAGILTDEHTASVQHTYHQVTGQTTAEVTHPMQITVTVTSPSSGTTINNVAVTVKVVDTQEGDLLVPEVWSGEHLVKGVVNVPANLTLTISPNATVKFWGNLGDGFEQGIHSIGAFTVGNGAVFRRDDEQTQNWGTLDITGQATLGSADIQDANVGVTIDDGSHVVLTGTKLHGNNTGLHVLGMSTAIVNGANISNNLYYGVKEDSGGRPAMTGTTILGNFRNYYSEDGALLDIDAINALNGGLGAGNVGE